jgi:hypothetical protein
VHLTTRTRRAGRGQRARRTLLLALLVALGAACAAADEEGGAPEDGPEQPAALEDPIDGDATAEDAADADAADADAADGDALDGSQPIRSAEGLHEQLRLRSASGELPEGHDPGSTDWRDREPPADLGDGYDTPGALALALAAALDAELLGEELWESTTRVLPDHSDDDQAYVAVLSWGFADDAVVGRDVRMTITRTGDGWAPGAAEERHHCLRGVDDDVCV